jgi:hypothetical protein
MKSAHIKHRHFSISEFCMFSFAIFALQTPSHEEAEGGDREKEEEEEEEEKEEQASTERPVACPMRKVPEMRCTWKGQIGDLKEHISKIHRRVLRPGNRFTSPSRTYCVQLVWCYDEVFLFYKYISADGVMSAFLQQVGISTSQFVCRMEVLSHSGLVPDTLNTFIVPQMSRYFRAICNDESCLTIDSGFIDYFVSNGEMDMSLQITRADQILESGVLEGEIPGTPPEEQEVGSDEEKIKCPLFKVAPFHCPVSEPATSLVEHLLSKHRYILIQEPEFDCEHVAIRVLLILFDNEVFLYYKHISQTSMHVLVQQVGLTNEKYKFRIELSAWDAEDNINFTGNATSIDEDFETVFNTYDCLTINLDNLDKFATNSDIDMKVKITRANTP